MVVSLSVNIICFRMAGGTRSAAESNMFKLIGKPADLPLADLPTRRNVIQKMLELRLTDSRIVNHIPILELAWKVAKLIKAKWLEINHKMEKVMVETKEVARKIFVLWGKVDFVASGGKKKKHKKKKKKREQGREEAKEFIESLDKLFDICSCHCPIFMCGIETACASNCQEKAHIKCSCPIGFKIPLLELEFMHDQRSKIGVHGKFQIGLKDAVESARQEKALIRETIRQQRLKEAEEKVASQVKELIIRKRRWEEDQQEALEEDIEDKNDESISGRVGRTSASGKWSGDQNRIHFPRTVMAGIRGGVSVRTMANILSSYTVDLGLATKEDPKLLVDHRKVTREQEKQMARVTANAEEWLRSSGIDSVQFDGKDENAKAWVTLECGTKVVRHVKEDHITLTDGQGEFLMHFTREKVEGVKAARVIASHMVDFFRKYGIDTTIKMIGADSTNVNTGCHEGAIVILERLLGRRLVWSICLLHTNELPLRHLLVELDGPTGSANTLTGPVGKLLPITQTLPYNPDFPPLSVGEALPVLPPEVIADLSWDQQFGYKFILALETGSIPASLQRMVIGPVDHSRWLTTGNRYNHCSICITILSDIFQNLRPMDA